MKRPVPSANGLGRVLSIAPEHIYSALNGNRPTTAGTLRRYPPAPVSRRNDTPAL